MLRISSLSRLSRSILGPFTNKFIKNRVCLSASIPIKRFYSTNDENTQNEIDEKYIQDILDRKVEFRPDIKRFNVVLLETASYSMEMAETLVSRMEEEYNLKPNAETFNILMNGYIHHERRKEAANVLVRMKEKKVKPDVVTLLSLFKISTSKFTYEAFKQYRGILLIIIIAIFAYFTEPKLRNAFSSKKPDEENK